MFTSTFLPVVVFSEIRAFLLPLAETRGVSETEVYKASGDYYKVFDFANVPLEINFPKRR